jgi:hypothetical protein
MVIPQEYQDFACENASQHLVLCPATALLGAGNMTVVRRGPLVG